MSQRVSFYVSKYIEGDPTIKVGLQRGLISTRILTKHIIQEERELKGSFDDVRNAIRKYSESTVPLFDLKNVYMAFKDSFIDVKSRLACIEINKKYKVEDINKMMNGVTTSNEKFARILNNDESFILMANEKEIEKISKMIKKEDIISLTKDITAVTLSLDPSVKFIPGVYFLIMGQISLNQINVYDLYSYKSEFTVYVDKKDGPAVYQILFDLIEYEKKFLNGKK